MCVSVIIKQFINVNCADISCELIKPDTEMVWLNMLNWQFNWYCLKKQNQNEEKEDKKNIDTKNNHNKKHDVIQMQSNENKIHNLALCFLSLHPY